MTDTQLWLAIGIPSFMVLLGIFLNMNSIKALRNEMESRFTGIENCFTGIEARLIAIEGDMRRFYEILGEHSGKIESYNARLTNLERK
jgi:hypothetical protein